VKVASDEIGTQHPATQFVSVISSESVQIAVPVQAGLRRRCL
jgi:hypothetical protein